jgi:hypothetical protein
MSKALLIPAVVLLFTLAHSSTMLAAPALAEETAFEVIFREVRWVNARATALEARSLPSTDLRNRYKHLFSLHDTADQAFKSIASSCMAEVDTLDARAAQIILAAKTKYRPQYGSTDRAPSVPAAPPELLSLQRQKTATIRKWLDALEGQIGRGRMAILSADVRRHVASRSVLEEAKAAK